MAKPSDPKLRETILAELARAPASVGDLFLSLGLGHDRLSNYLSDMERDGLVRSRLVRRVHQLRARYGGHSARENTARVYELVPQPKRRSRS